MRYQKFKKTLITLMTMTLCNLGFSEEYSSKDYDNNDTKDLDQSTSAKEVIQGCSTKGGLHLALATGDFWCEPDKPDPYPCGGYYLGFPDNTHNPPNNFVPPSNVTLCGKESNIRSGGAYIKPTTDENTSVFIVKENITEPTCLIEMHSVNVKDIKGSNVIDFTFYISINKCPPPPPTPPGGTPVPPGGGSGGGCGGSSIVEGHNVCVLGMGGFGHIGGSNIQSTRGTTSLELWNIQPWDGIDGYGRDWNSILDKYSDSADILNIPEVRDAWMGAGKGVVLPDVSKLPDKLPATLDSNYDYNKREIDGVVVKGWVIPEK